MTQQCATRFILNDYRLDYKSHLSSLNLLLLMMNLEFNDILLFIENYHYPQSSFDITTGWKFTSSSTQASSTSKLSFNRPYTNSSHHLFFNHFPQLWNGLPQLDLSLSLDTLKKLIKQVFWNHFLTNFNSDNPCTFHFVCACNPCTSLPLRTNFNPSR